MSADQLLVDTAERVFAETCTPAVLAQSEIDGVAPTVWSALAEVGLPWVGVPESAGGAGGELADALAVLRVAGRHSVPAPLAETGLLAGWLQAEAGLAVGAGPATIVPGRAGDTVRLAGGRLQGVARGVPWARSSERIVLLADDEGGGETWSTVVVGGEGARIEAMTNLAGEPRDTVVFDDVVPLVVGSSSVRPDDLVLRGALTRVALMAGALEAMCRMTVAYTAERRQFGQPVARFQLVQEHLVRLAQDAALVGLAADAVVRAVAASVAGGRSWEAAAFEIASSKAMASRAATTATKAAHQAHGAMGMTREYPLHLLTRRLWAWREEHGNEAWWNRVVGEMAAVTGADGLFDLVSRGSESDGPGPTPPGAR